MESERVAPVKQRPTLRVVTLALLALIVAVVPLNLAIGITHPAFAAVYGLVAACYLVMGLLIVERRPDNRVGPITLAIGAGVAISLVVDSYVSYGSTGPGLPGRDIVAWAFSLGDGPLYAALAILVLLFPTGRLPSARWRPVAGSVVALGLATSVTTGLRPGPLPYHDWIDNPLGVAVPFAVEVAGSIQLLFAAPILLALLAPVARWRVGGPVERAQLKWIGASGLGIMASIAFYAVVIGPDTYDRSADLVVGGMVATFPVAVAIAVTRYRLFDIDRIISRTVGWAIVSGAVIAIYLVAVLVLQAALAGIIQGDTLAVAVSTLLAAATFQPLRRRVQGAVDLRFNRARVDAERAAAAFADRLRDEVEVETLARDLDSAARDAVAPRSIGLWLHARNDSRTTNG
jgi:hypothetical protein